MFEIIPGILEQEWSEIEKKLDLVKPFAKTVHIDIIDGVFAPHTTFLDPIPFARYKEDFLLEAHLMVDRPEDYLESFAKSGFHRFLGHIEKMADPVEFVAKGQQLGEIGLAIDGPTDLQALDKIHLDDLDTILIMTIKAGASGQEFEPELLRKVKELKRKSFLPLTVDGGINDTTIQKAKESGASRFIANNYLFNSENIEDCYSALDALAKG